MLMAAVGVAVTPSRPKFGGPHVQAYAEGPAFGRRRLAPFL
jgi:hypothetical protein